MRRALPLILLAALASCDPLLDYTAGFQVIWIDSPSGDDELLGASTFPLVISTSCTQIAYIDILVNDIVGGYGTGEPCGDGQRCFTVDIEPAMRTGQFWPARVEARLTCTGHAGTFLSEPISVKISPFPKLWFLPARATALVPAPGALIAVSEQGLHRIETAGESEVQTFASRATAPRAFRVDDDLYYHAPCDDPLRCDAGAPDLFRIDAPTLLPTGDRAVLECAPMAVAAAGPDRRAMVLGDCDQPRVRWSAANLGDPVEEALDAQPTRTARAQDGLTFVAVRGDEVVIAVAGAEPPLVTRATGVRAALPVTAISDDGTRAAVLDLATGALSHIDVASGAVIASATLPPHAEVEWIGASFVPGTHGLLVSFADEVWLAEGDPAVPPLRITPLADEDPTGPMTLRAAALIDRERTAYFAEYASGTPALFLDSGTVVDALATLGPDWTLTAPPLVHGDALYLAFDTARGPVIAQQPIAPR